MKDSGTEEFYTRNASLYQKVFIESLHWDNQLAKFFNKSNYLRSNIKVLDAGCGTGAATKSLYRIAEEKNYYGIQFYGFDLADSMLEIFRKWITVMCTNNIKLAKANVLDMTSFPVEWNDFDLIISSTMLEYLPRNKVNDALANLKSMLKPNGKIVVIITKRNILTSWLAGKWWKANLYKKEEIQQAFRDAGFDRIVFRKFIFGWSSAIIVIEGEK